MDYFGNEAKEPQSYNYYYQGWSSERFIYYVDGLLGLNCSTQNPLSSNSKNFNPYDQKKLFKSLPDSSKLPIGGYSGGSNGDYGSGGGSASYFGKGGNAGTGGSVEGKEGGPGSGGGGARYVFAGAPTGGDGGSGFAIVFY